MDVELPFSSSQKFVVIEFGGYIAIVHKALPIDATVGAQMFCSPP